MDKKEKIVCTIINTVNNIVTIINHHISPADIEQLSNQFRNTLLYESGSINCGEYKQTTDTFDIR